MAAGYSNAPLAQKLGIKCGQRTWRSEMPASVQAALAACGVSPELLRKPTKGIEMAHLFVTKRRDLCEQLMKIRPLLASYGVIWISWPKKASGVPTDLVEDVIRAEALPLDLVDIKVCAVVETWSGLKFVNPLAKRS